MLEEKFYFSLPNWRLFKFFDIRKDQFMYEVDKEVQFQNKKGFIIIFELEDENQNKLNIRCYKKHATSILKSIVIGKLSLLDFSELKKRIDMYTPQSEVINSLFDKPVNKKYLNHKKMYFPSN